MQDGVLIGRNQLAQPVQTSYRIEHTAREFRNDANGVPASFVMWRTKRFSRAEFFQVHRTSFHLGAADEMVETSITQKLKHLNPSWVYSKHQQTHGGCPVSSAIYCISEFAGQVISGLGHIAPGLAINTAAAVKAVNAVSYRWQTDPTRFPHPKGDLVIYSPDFGQATPFALAYRYLIAAENPWNSWRVHVDAVTGAVIDCVSVLRTVDVPGSGIKLDGGAVSLTVDKSNAKPSQYLLTEADKRCIFTYSQPPKGKLVYFTDPDGSFSDLPERPGVSVHWGTERVWDYLEQRLGRRGLDGGGAFINSYVHVKGNCGGTGTHWDPAAMGVQYCGAPGAGPLDLVNAPFMAELFVVGHELGHGVAEACFGGFDWGREQEALDESFADMLGISVVAFNGAPDEWVGMKDFPHHRARDMANPKATGRPDTYLGTMWNSLKPESHNDCLVPDHWLYLLAMGGSGVNERGWAYGTPAVPLLGVGREKAEIIAFLTLTTKLSPQSDFSQARDGSLAQAFELYGPGSPEVVATANAWHAVGVGDPYGVQPKHYTSPAANASSVEPWPFILSFETPLSYSGNRAGGGSDYEWEWQIQLSADPDFLVNVHTDTTSNQSAGELRTLTYCAPFDLQANTVYYWRARANWYESGWEQEWGQTLSFETDAKLPVNVTPIAGTEAYPWPAVFTWDPVPGAVGYELEVSEGTIFPGTQTFTDKPLAAKSESLKLRARQDYIWRVRAKGPGTGNRGSWAQSFQTATQGRPSSDWNDFIRPWSVDIALSFTTADPVPSIASPSNGEKDLPPWSLPFVWNNKNAASYQLVVFKDALQRATQQATAVAGLPVSSVKYL